MLYVEPALVFVEIEGNALCEIQRFLREFYLIACGKSRLSKVSFLVDVGNKLNVSRGR